MADNVIVRVPEQQFIKGEDGYSPEVTIENIDHGHSVNITDREHPEGQSFNVMDGDSAYEQAVAGGYTKSEAQFNAELGSFGKLSDETKEAAPFYAEYGVTTKAEIEAAINGKRQIYAYQSLSPYSPILPYVGKIHYDDEQGSGTGYRFSIIEGTTQIVYELMSTWVYYTNDLSEPAQRAEAAAAQALIRMNSAGASAQAAAGSAGDASTAATTATTKAGEASDSATAADGSAKDSEAYAIGKRGGVDVTSADPTYHNNAKYYADQASGSATAASGSATSAASSAAAAGNAQTAAETAQGAAEDAQAAAEAVLASIPSDYTELTEDVSDLKSAINTKAPIIINTASGAIASFDDGAADMSLKGLTVDIEPVQGGSGDPSPDNVRPISGWTGCNIVQSPTLNAQDGTTYPITFPTEAGTVYGGTLDVTNGVLTMNAFYCATNAEGKLVRYIPGETPTTSGCYWQSGYGYYGLPSRAVPFSDAETQACNRYAIQTGQDVVTRDNYCRIRKVSAYTRLTFKQTSIPGWGTEEFAKDDLEAYFAENPLQAVIPLDEPITIQLTPTQIDMLLGTNNIWADCGDVSVDYPADTKLYIDGKIAELQATVLENIGG